MTPAAELTPPQAPQNQRMLEIRKDLERFEIEFREFLRRLDALTQSVYEHGDRLDDHDRKLISVDEGVREIRGNLHQTQSDVHRLADGYTVQVITGERQEKTLEAQRKALEAIARNTSEVLSLLQQRVTL